VCARLSTGEAAVERVSLGDVGIVIMDIKLDGVMDGIEAAEKIHAIVDIRLIFLTVYANDALIERAKRILPYGYLVKPYHCRELRAAIALALYRHKGQLTTFAKPCKPVLEQAGSRRERELVSICSSCKRIRNSEGAWESSQVYYENRLSIRFTYSICPQCADRLYRDLNLYD
jgi:DNA-binding NarL/FixJ family response regulator